MPALPNQVRLASPRRGEFLCSVMRFHLHRCKQSPATPKPPQSMYGRSFYVMHMLLYAVYYNCEGIGWCFSSHSRLHDLCKYKFITLLCCSKMAVLSRAETRPPLRWVLSYIIQNWEWREKNVATASVSVSKESECTVDWRPTHLCLWWQLESGVDRAIPSVPLVGSDYWSKRMKFHPFLGQRVCQGVSQA